MPRRMLSALNCPPPTALPPSPPPPSLRRAACLQCPQGTPIKRGQEVRLQHMGTRRWLHSHHFTAPLSNNQEVRGAGCGQGGAGLGGRCPLVGSSLAASCDREVSKCAAHPARCAPAPLCPPPARRSAAAGQRLWRRQHQRLRRRLGGRARGQCHQVDARRQGDAAPPADRRLPQQPQRAVPAPHPGAHRGLRRQDQGQPRAVAGHRRRLLPRPQGG